jgi:steroid 5-alpha reductase family enzyme
MTTLDVLIANLGTALLVMALAWIVHLIARKASVVDSFWGLGFVAIVWLTFALAPGTLDRKLLVAVLTTIWGLRLTAHVSWRNWGEPEDPRYADMRDKHPEAFWWRSLFTVFLLQAVIMWIVALPIQLAQMYPAPAFTWLDLLGTVLWCFGFFWEAVGDWQLARFKANPANKGRVLDSGLWRYTRHPNYFGEACMWWGLFLVALSVPGGWWAIFGPAVLTALLLKVSGIAMTEKKLSERHTDYDEYKRRTSAFLPRPPKETTTSEESGA